MSNKETRTSTIGIEIKIHRAILDLDFRTRNLDYPPALCKSALISSQIYNHSIQGLKFEYRLSCNLHNSSNHYYCLEEYFLADSIHLPE